MKKQFLLPLIFLEIFTLTSCFFNIKENSPVATIENECPFHLPFPSDLYSYVTISQYPLNIDPNNSTHKGIFEYAYDFSVRRYLNEHPRVDVDIVASRDGIVTAAVGRFINDVDCGGDEEAKNKGNYVIIDHRDGTFSLYLHLKSVSVKEGDSVKQGQKIGLYGNTGWTELEPGKGCKAHLHYQVQKTRRYTTQSIETCFAEYKNGVLIFSPSEDFPSVSGYAIASEKSEKIAYLNTDGNIWVMAGLSIGKGLVLKSGILNSRE